MTDLFVFIAVPVTGIFLLFLKDKDKDRRFLLNALIVFNNIIYFGPILLAFLNTPKEESMWNEATGGGSWLWAYILVFPLCAVIQLILFIVKLLIHLRS